MGIFNKPYVPKELSFHLATAAMLYGQALNNFSNQDRRYLGEILASIMDFWVFQTKDKNIRMTFDLFQIDLQDDPFKAKYSVDHVREIFKTVPDSESFLSLQEEYSKSFTSQGDTRAFIELMMKMGGISNELSENEDINIRDQSATSVILDVLRKCEIKMNENTNRKGELNQEGQDAYFRGISAITIGALLLTLYKSDSNI